MTEKNQQIRVIIKLLICVAFGILYAWGGMEHKWLRRFVAPAVLCLSMFAFSRNWRTLPQMLLMFGSLSLGYGATTLWLKILRRGLFGLANGITSSGYNFWRKKWLLAGTQIGLLIALYIIMGVWNPIGSARAEESFLGIMIALIPLLSTRS